MKILKLTKADFKKSDSYYSDYVGKEDVSDFDGHIEIDGDLGWVRFVSVKVSGYIKTGTSTGIEAGERIKAGEGIEAGSGIEAGEGIKAGWGIEAGKGIKAGWGIEAGKGIKAGWGIEAGKGIEAGSGIEAGEGIKAGWGIEAGKGIEAGWGIIAGLSISCKSTISASLKIFAGICWWREITDDEKKITCKKLEKGIVAYGILEESEAIKSK